MSNYIFIKDWEELANKIPQESNTHILEISNGSAWLKSKNNKYKNYYLSTHTFYRSSYMWSSELLRSCGFQVTLNNWDDGSPENKKYEY